jgi:hypothetical protein
VRFFISRSVVKEGFDFQEIPRDFGARCSFGSAPENAKTLPSLRLCGFLFLIRLQKQAFDAPGK